MASIYDTWMQTLVEDDGVTSGPQQQAAFLAYLNGSSTADEVGQACTRPIAESEDSLVELPWILLIDAAKKFPQAHQKLTELAGVLARVSTTGEETATFSAAKYSDFTFELSETYRGAESASLSSHSTKTTERQYVNLCAFIARSWHHKQGDWTNWALQLMVDGLEDKHAKELTNLFGKAVSQLFLFSGPEMYGCSNSAKVSTYVAGPLLKEARKTATVGRWDFWKQRFAQLKESELLTDETTELFSKALESMATVEAEG